MYQVSKSVIRLLNDGFRAIYTDDGFNYLKSVVALPKDFNENIRPVLRDLNSASRCCSADSSIDSVRLSGRKAHIARKFTGT
jgi:hypothetical protein